MKIKNTFSRSKKVLVATGVALSSGTTNAMALAATDFDTGTAVADIGLAVVAVLGVVVVVFGFRKVVGMFR